VVPGVDGARSARLVLTLEPFDVQKILVTTGRFLILDEMVSREHIDLLVAERSFDPLGPGLIEIDAVDSRDDINADRLDSDLEDESRLRQILYRQIVKRRAECLQGRYGSTSVRRLRSNPNIQILGRANEPMGGERVSTNDDKLNAVGVEFG